MNDIFSFKRFWFFAIKEFFEKRLLLMGFLCVTIIIFLLTYSSGSENSEAIQYQHISLFLGMILGPAILVSFLLGSFSKKNSSVQFLTLPVSFFERWLVLVLITFVIYIPTVIFFLYFIDYYFVSYFRELALEKKQIPADVLDTKFKYIGFILNPKSGVFKGYLLALSVLTGFFALGALYFKNLSFYKTSLVVFFLFVSIVFFRNNVTKFIIGENINTNINDFANAVVILKDNNRIFIASSEGIAFAMNSFVKVILPVCLWLIALLGFKEKEI
jgi:hypothetical protein